MILSYNEDNLADEYSDKAKSELASLMKQESFFHDLDFGDFRTGSWVYPKEDMPPNYHLFSTFNILNRLNIKGSRCLDIGTFDGMTAFVLSEREAAHIDATCQYDLPRFRQARAYGGYENIAYYPQTDVHAINDSFEMGVYDLVCMNAMLHHLLSPLDGIIIARKLLKNGAYLLLDAAVLPGEEAVLKLNTELENPVYGAPTVWLPTESALLGMFKLAGFETVEVKVIEGARVANDVNFKRVTVLARAVKPSEVTNRSEKLQEVHGVPNWNQLIDFKALETKQTDKAVISLISTDTTRAVNIWLDAPKIDLQPAWEPSDVQRETCFRVGTNDHFLQLMAENSDDQWDARDTTLLAAVYPGEVFPEGMSWSMKQYANLFCLSYAKRWGLKNILEVGAGFNLFFDRHLPDDCDYTVLDDEGFYDQNVLNLARNMRKRDKFVSGLLGHPSNSLADEQFDGTISSSVLEHIPLDEVEAAVKDMFRILKPGGWALHSIDLTPSSFEKYTTHWQDCLIAAGFIIDPQGVSLDLNASLQPGNEVFVEPLAIVDRFYGGYSGKPGANAPKKGKSGRWHTVLFAARKPFS